MQTLQQGCCERCHHAATAKQSYMVHEELLFQDPSKSRCYKSSQEAQNCSLYLKRQIKLNEEQNRATQDSKWAALTCLRARFPMIRFHFSLEEFILPTFTCNIDIKELNDCCLFSLSNIKHYKTKPFCLVQNTMYNPEGCFYSQHGMKFLTMTKSMWWRGKNTTQIQYSRSDFNKEEKVDHL